MVGHCPADLGRRGAFDFHGKYFQLTGLMGQPGPWGGTRLLMMNAGLSAAGRAFAIRNSDLHFDQPLSPEQAIERVQETKRNAAALGRELQMFSTGFVVCRPTQKEAEDYYHYYAVEEADWDAVDRVLELVLGKEGPQGMEAEMAYRLRERFATGFGGMPFIGDPDHVASELARIAGWGFDGVVFGFVNYLEELPFLAQEVLPRLERMDLRQPFSEGSK